MTVMIGQYEVAYFIILTVYGVHTQWTGFHQIIMQTICVFENSRWWCRDTEAVNALSQSWQGENNWMVSPPKLINKVINKMKSVRALGIIVVPVWKLVPYWPLLHGKRYVKDQMLLTENSVVPDKGQNGIFAKSLNFRMMAFRVSFS